MCSRTRGPASAPSLVTCPTSTTVQPVCLAYWTSLEAHSRTWATAPGADCSASLHSVWIESMTMKLGRLAAAVASTVSRLVSVRHSRPSGSSPSRCARIATWAADSSPVT